MTVNNVQYKIDRWLDSNRRPLVSEATLYRLSHNTAQFFITWRKCFKKLVSSFSFSHTSQFFADGWRLTPQNTIFDIVSFEFFAAWNKTQFFQRSINLFYLLPVSLLQLFSFEFSVTRFGEISSLWHKLKCLWQFYEGLIRFGKKCYRFWSILYIIGQFFMVVNGQIMKTVKALWSHCLNGFHLDLPTYYT